WEVDSGKELRRFGKEDLSPELITLSANGKVLAAASMDGNRFVPLPAQRAGEQAQKMVPPGCSSTIWVWDATTGKELCRIKSKQQALGRGDKDGKIQEVVGGVDYPAGLALSPDGKSLAVLYGDGRIALLDATTGKKLLQIGNKAAAAAPGAVAESGP